MPTLPALFLGHGNPMHAIREDAYTQAWAAIGRALPRPQAILSISAHYYIADVAVTVNAAPPTIHDFSGFPRALFEVEYPAPGDPALARRVEALLSPLYVTPDEDWGLDHGTWSVLRHVYPAADIPVVQLSIDARQPPHFHYDLGRKLGALRDEGVLLVGSGNIVHNLRAFRWDGPAEPYDWAVRFDAQVRTLLQADDAASLMDYPALGRDALLAAPTPDHYLPLLYILGARRPGEAVTFPVGGFDGGAISMLAVQFG